MRTILQGMGVGVLLVILLLGPLAIWSHVQSKALPTEGWIMDPHMAEEPEEPAAEIVVDENDIFTYGPVTAPWGQVKDGAIRDGRVVDRECYRARRVPGLYIGPRWYLTTTGADHVLGLYYMGDDGAWWRTTGFCGGPPGESGIIQTVRGGVTTVSGRVPMHAQEFEQDPERR